MTGPIYAKDLLKAVEELLTLIEKTENDHGTGFLRIFNEYMHKFRVGQDISVERLSEQTGLSIRQIDSIENAMLVPPKYVLFMLAVVYNWTPEGIADLSKHLMNVYYKRVDVTEEKIA